MFIALTLLTITAIIAWLAGRSTQITAYERRIDHLIHEVHRLQGEKYRRLVERKRISPARLERDYVVLREDPDEKFFDKNTWIEE